MGLLAHRAVGNRLDQAIAALHFNDLERLVALHDHDEFLAVPDLDGGKLHLGRRRGDRSHDLDRDGNVEAAHGGVVGTQHHVGRPGAHIEARLQFGGDLIDHLETLPFQQLRGGDHEIGVGAGVEREVRVVTHRDLHRTGRGASLAGLGHGDQFRRLGEVVIAVRLDRQGHFLGRVGKGHVNDDFLVADKSLRVHRGGQVGRIARVERVHRDGRRRASAGNPRAGDPDHLFAGVGDLELMHLGGAEGHRSEILRPFRKELFGFAGAQRRDQRHHNHHRQATLKHEIPSRVGHVIQ